MLEIIYSIRDGMKEAWSSLEEKFEGVNDAEFKQLEEFLLENLDSWNWGTFLSYKCRKLQNFIYVRRCLSHARVRGYDDFNVKMDPFPPRYVYSNKFANIQERFIKYLQQIEFVVNNERFRLVFEQKESAYELFSLKASISRLSQVLEIFKSSMSEEDELVIAEIPEPSDVEVDDAPDDDYCYSFFVIRSKTGKIQSVHKDFHIKKLDIKLTAPSRDSA
ncbi:uncharacterized protein J8A68_000071 [[Candida] subhashii]|uniref:Uncharacterized protein n=1 Tax=[Candida] subhashii TaxID=561895 RepID=A0A8J5QX96_9ASCO|nr:uncharacterized protein J8A68_000071 [[Candida] subhashii]KAG7666397.1 hypothetical protein J8A68_000071 [[Candida] subhashii]